MSKIKELLILALLLPFIIILYPVMRIAYWLIGDDWEDYEGRRHLDEV